MIGGAILFVAGVALAVGVLQALHTARSEAKGGRRKRR